MQSPITHKSVLLLLLEQYSSFYVARMLKKFFLGGRGFVWVLIITITNLSNLIGYQLHRIHKWRTRGKKLVPSHESEALEDKQKLQMKTFSELAECLARIAPKITLYRLLFKNNYVRSLLLLMFSIDLLFASKGTRISSRKQGDFVGFRSMRSSTSGR